MTLRPLFLVLLVTCFRSWCGVQRAAAATVANFTGANYDVATVKVNKTGSGSSRLSIHDGMLQATNVQLQILFESAFDTPRDQIAGLPHRGHVERIELASALGLQTRG